MSSVQVITARREKGRYIDIEEPFGQIERDSEYSTLAELEEISAIGVSSPVTVENDKLVIDSNRLEIERIYPFAYLGSQMVLWKNTDDSVDLYEIVE